MQTQKMILAIVFTLRILCQFFGYGFDFSGKWLSYDGGFLRNLARNLFGDAGFDGICRNTSSPRRAFVCTSAERLRYYPSRESQNATDADLEKRIGEKFLNGRMRHRKQPSPDNRNEQRENAATEHNAANFRLRVETKGTDSNRHRSESGQQRPFEHCYSIKRGSGKQHVCRKSLRSEKSSSNDLGQHVLNGVE